MKRSAPTGLCYWQIRFFNSQTQRGEDMVKYISLVLLAFALLACSTNEVNNPETRNAKEHSEMMTKIEQYQQEDSLEIARMRRDIVLYRQTILKAISDLDIAAGQLELSKSGPSVSNARAQSDTLKHQALRIQEQQINDIKTQLFTAISDSLYESPDKINTISYQEKVAELEAEVAEIRKYLRQINNNTGIHVSEKPQSITEQPKPVKTEAGTAVEKAAPVVEIVPEVTVSPEAQLEYDNARILYDSGDYDSAITLFSAFLEKYPKQQLAANAMYWLGESYYSIEEYRKAIKEFERITWKYPNSAKAPDAQFKLGLSYLKLGDKFLARQELEKVKRQYPNYERMNQVNSYLSGLK
jgi:tol-pal system protein YbgF